MAARVLPELTLELGQHRVWGLCNVQTRSADRHILTWPKDRIYFDPEDSKAETLVKPGYELFAIEAGTGNRRWVQIRLSLHPI